MLIQKDDGWIEITLHDAICPPDQEHHVQLNTTKHWFRTSLDNKWRKHWSGWRLRKIAEDSTSVNIFEQTVKV